ncbi:MAG TPA: DNA translocase FtsK 4TM domain-containing protein, partial [Dyadobacter sp.]|nr:DNA translocase FtsK 4TM domain-containing protein [Dyadobacter sp.]
MAVNKPRGNTQRQQEQKAAGSRLRFSIDWDGIFASPKGTLAWGIFFMILGVIMEISFVSYIFTGITDQSVVDNLGEQSIRDAGRQTRNVLGVMGATISHIFVYRWFGISAILLPVIAVLGGWKIAFGREPYSLSRKTKEVIFFLLWGSVLMGYVVLMSNQESSLSFVSGGLGYAVNVFLFDWLKWGSIIPIIFALFLFAVYFYDFRDTIEQWQVKNATPEPVPFEVNADANPTAEPVSEEAEKVKTEESKYVSVVNDTYD